MRQHRYIFFFLLIFCFSPAFAWNFSIETTREISYLPYGWEERGKLADLSFLARTYFLDTDIIYKEVEIKNPTREEKEITPVLLLSGKPTLNSGREPTPSVYEEVSLKHRDYPLLLSSHSPVTATLSVAGPLNAKYWEYRGILTNFPAREIKKNLGETSFQGKESLMYEYQVIGQPIKIPPDEKVKFFALSGFSLGSEQETISLVQKGKDIISHYPEEVHQRIRQKWEDYFSSASSPHTTDPEFLRVYYQALTGIQMYLYAPINKMNYTGTVPIKGFYNAFWGWDSCFHSLELCPLDVELAKESLLVQFAAQLENGCLPGIVGDDEKAWSHLRGEIIAGENEDTQAPVQGWAIEEILCHDFSASKKAFAEKVYPVLGKYVAWWQQRIRGTLPIF